MGAAAADAPVAVDTRSRLLDAARPLVVGRGWAAVGLSEVLAVAGVPKGSFYHWFRSKEQFGEALVERHFERYEAEVDAVLGDASRPPRERLAAYFDAWHATQTGDDPTRRCLVVKLSAEVCDLSEPMRAALDRGTARIVERLTRCIAAARDAGELPRDVDAGAAAQAWYQRWLGATLLARVQRGAAPLDAARHATRRWLGLATAPD